MCKEFVCNMRESCINEEICFNSGCLLFRNTPCANCLLLKSCDVRYDLIQQIIDFIEERGVFIYAGLMEYSRVSRRDWLPVLNGQGSLIIKEYIKNKC